MEGVRSCLSASSRTSCLANARTSTVPERLGRMRDHTLALNAVGGNAISDAYLAATLHHRAQSLADDPDTPLFFGRIDTADESLHIGRRRHVGDERATLSSWIGAPRCRAPSTVRPDASRWGYGSGDASASCAGRSRRTKTNT